METLEGTVSHLQNTVSVSGGGNDTRSTTTYIALFRLDGQPVQFRCGKPIPFADGDRVKVAGRRRAADLYAYAARDLTTGAILNAGVWGNVIMAMILPLFGLFFCGIASHVLGKIRRAPVPPFPGGHGLPHRELPCGPRRRCGSCANDHESARGSQRTTTWHDPAPAGAGPRGLIPRPAESDGCQRGRKAV